MNTFNADDRAPAGEIAFDGALTGAVSGVGWGDRYRFKTTSAGPISVNSTWDYTQKVDAFVAWLGPEAAPGRLVCLTAAPHALTRSCRAVPFFDFALGRA